MTIATAGRGQFEFGQVIEGAFGAIKRNFLQFLAFSALFSGVPGVIYAWLLISGVGRMDFSAAGPKMLLGWVLTSVTGAILQAVLVQATFADMQHRKASFASCLRAGLEHFLPLLVIGLLSGLGVALGLLLLIVPGVILALMWSVAAPVQIVENVGIIEAFKRSAKLTQNHRGAIFGMFLLVAIISWGIALVLNLSVVAAAGAVGLISYASLVSVPLGQMIGGVLRGAIAAVLYFELRRTKEGLTRDDLGDVFD